MTNPVVPCAPAEAARRAAWWRAYSNAPGATEAERAHRWRVSERYQDMSCTDYVADRHDASEAKDE